MAFAALTIDLNARLAKFEQDLQKAGGSLDSLNKRVSTFASGFSRAFGALGIGVGVAGLGAFVKSGIDAADALNDMSLRLGVSVKDLASLKLAAEQSGTSLDSVGTGIARLSRSIGDAESGNKNLAKSLKDLGITARDPKEAFFQLADAVKRIEDPSKRASLLSDVLGKSYGELIPILSQGSEELRKSAEATETFSDAMARLAPEADKFNDQLVLLKINAAGAAATIIGPLVSSFNEWIAVGQEVIKTGSLLDKIRFFGLGNASDEIVTRVRKAADESAKAIARMRKLAASGETIKLPKLEAPKAQKQAAAVKTKLDEIDPFIRERTAALKAQADEIAEIERDVAEHLKATNDEIFAQGQAWAEAGRALEDDMRTPLEKANIEFARLDDLLSQGIITWETYTRAVIKTQEAIETVPDKLQEMDEFSKNAAESMQRSFAEFFFDPMENGFKGMVDSFGKAILRMVADAAAADLTRALFGGSDKQGSGSSKGGLLDIFSSVGKLFSFDTGTDFVPRDMIAKIHKGERIIPANQNNGRTGINITVNVSGNTNAPDVRRAAAQGAREAMGLMSGAQRYA